MGIDAEILVRGVPATTVTDEWLKDISWRLAQAIGTKHFWIQDGLLPKEYERASTAWHEAFDNHPAYKARSADTGFDRDAVIADIGQPPTARRLAIEPTGTHYRDEGDPPPGSLYTQDGDDVLAEPGECLLKLSLWGRYYGPGYERGDILTYCAIAEWLEANIPGCTVWYGGDSSGVEAEPFGAEQREAMKQHLYSKQGRDYFKRDGFGSSSEAPRPTPCGLCPGGTYHGAQFGFGRNYAAYHCPGCGKTVESHDNGKTWVEKKES